MSRRGPNTEPRPLPASNASPRWAVWLATGLGAGYLPVMPGTYGSVLGVGLYVGLASVSLRLAHPRTFLALATIVIAGASIAVVAAALKAFRADDPAQIVLDEVAGQWITLLPLAMTPEGKSSGWAGIALGFLLFRAFDTLKPYPIQKLEKLPGAWGVVADDLGAGVAAGLLLAAASRWWGIL